MKRCKTHLVRVCLLMLAAVPVYAQRGTFGIDVGQTSDKFGGLTSVSGFEMGIDGQIAIIQSKKGGASIVAGGEIRLPSDTQNHAKEFAIFGGPAIPIGHLTLGVNAQIRKIYLPPANVDNQIFVRYKMELLEIPVVLKYNFGPTRRAFIEVQGAPEFHPRFRSAGSTLPLPNPNFDHGYFVRGTAGYNFGRWYVKGSYESRYFSFLQNQNNPTNLYNWKSNLASGGVGVSF